MKITHQKGRGKKIHILIDGEYKITTDIDFWNLNFISNDTEISEEEFEQLVEKIERRKAVNKCYDLLSRRDHSQKELERKLLKTVSYENAKYVTELMIEKGFIDDNKYAEKLFDYLSGKKYSKSHIIAEMRKRGIDKDIVDNVVSCREIDSVEIICDLLNTKYSLKIKAENGKEKVISALLRKGFSYSDIKSAFYRMETDSYEF